MSFLGCLFGGVVGGFLQIIMSLPTEVEVELGCDNLSLLILR